MSKMQLKPADNFSHEMLPQATELDRIWAGVRNLSFLSGTFKSFSRLNMQQAQEFLTGYNYLRYRMAERGRVPFIEQDANTKVNVWNEDAFIYAYFQSKLMRNTASIFAFGQSETGQASYDAFNVRLVEISTPCISSDYSFLGATHEAVFTGQKPPLSYAVSALTVIHGLMDNLPGNFLMA